MGQPAARVTDLAGHGGPIVYGEPTVLIGGFPAARVGDPFACPGFDGLKPHVAGNILMGSTSVIIGGSFAARLGDLTGCGIAGVIGKNMPAVKGPKGGGNGNGKKSGNKSPEFLWWEGESYSNILGIRGEGEGSIVHFEGKGDTRVGEFNAGLDLGHVEVEGHVGLLSLGGKAEVTFINKEVGWQNSPDNPVHSIMEGEGKLLTLEIMLDVLLGTDGRRFGLGVGAGVLAAAAAGDVSNETEIKIPIPFTDYSIAIGSKEKIGDEIAPTGLKGLLALYYDTKDSKLHFKAEGVLGLVIDDLEIDVDITLGIVSNTPPPSVNGIGIPMTPGIVITGFATVSIG